MFGGMSAGFVMVIYIVLIFGFVYFASIRPQKKEQKRVGAMLAGMEYAVKSDFIGILDACEFARYAPVSGHTMQDLYNDTTKIINQLENNKL